MQLKQDATVNRRVPVERLPSSGQPVFSYSGGKRQLASRIVNLFRKHFPTETRLLSPFIGGAAVELAFMFSRRGFCHAADADEHLIMFWRNLITDARAVANHARSLMVEPMDRERWQAWYRDMMAGGWHSAEHAAQYFILRYTKVVHAWSVWEKRAEGFNEPRVHKEAFARLSRFRVPRLSVEHADFRSFLLAHDGIAYLDPPYFSDDLSYEKVYEKRAAADDNVFTRESHEDLAELLSARKGWVLSYSPHEWVRNRYRDYTQLEVEVSYMSRSSQQRDNRDTELIIISA